MENNELTDYVAHVAVSIRNSRDNGILCALVVGLDYDQFVRADLDFLHNVGAITRGNIADIEYAYDQSYTWARIGVIMALAATKYAKNEGTIGAAVILALDYDGFRAFDWHALDRAGVISRIPWFVPHVRALSCEEYDALRETARRAVLDALA